MAFILSLKMSDEWAERLDAEVERIKASTPGCTRTTRHSVALYLLQRGLESAERKAIREAKR